ncbi:FIST signal transduction protein [Aquimarina muelleri]|uniref:Histidine kinase n=1 Tax=Aquimarina muelleri TaxID=279356 RepID=A0A918N4N9_9FLAO|nr:FIST N-terminal domain-containing protein [Aquimarina muelleri]MCX2762565.1 FIST C-terminal domain-containing protein [Aquimarina muelleri]GGX24163.1 histidine kinase [Aquimarina muelleri]
MRFQQFEKKKNQEWSPLIGKGLTLQKPLVLVFGNRYALEAPEIYNEVKKLFPDGEIVFGSTAGEIIGSQVLEDSITLTAIEFEKSTYAIFRENSLDHDKDAIQLGKTLIQKVSKDGLKHILVISEGSFINGSALIEGLETGIDNVAITGGLCGDDSRFEKTISSYNENPKEGEVILIAFYGESLEISFAQYGGWTPFGPERIVTKSDQNILYELDNLPALDLYKKYLGDKAAELPQSALLYPLSVKSKNKKEPIVRTILTIDEQTNTMTLAGDVPEGSVVQLMMANIDHIVDGALKAAEIGMKNRKNKPELAVLVSCIGRKLVMDQRVEEEIEEVIEVIGTQAVVNGFYSYGELAPFTGNINCELHNQTMTLTLFSE